VVSDSPIQSFLQARGVLLLDGGLATELERRGHDLNHSLWSARLLLEAPDAIRDVHRAYLDAGADCLITASYQASLPGLKAAGLSGSSAVDLLRRAVAVACEARDDFAHEAGGGNGGRRLRPLVAASVGPYGAYLADGSEYRGNYGVSQGELREFHELRWNILSESGADLIACETLPDLDEARVLLELLEHTEGPPAWVSFSCRDAARINDGTPIAEGVSLFRDCDRVIAVGVNCSAPVHIGELIDTIRAAAPNKQIVVYPNSGEGYDGERREWIGESDPRDFGKLAQEWFDRGARLIGGCCRTGPDHIRAIREALSRPPRP
jgi:homocysteine S-methyltransferase